MRRYVVGVTGASGSLCARSVLRHLSRHPEVERVHVVLSHFSLQTLGAELGKAVRVAQRTAGHDPLPGWL